MRSAAWLERELLEQLVGPGVDLVAVEVRELADQHEVLAAGEVLVDRGVLAGEPDVGPDRLRVLLARRRRARGRCRRRAAAAW